MNGEEFRAAATDNESVPLSPSAENKRRVARRRFLAKGTATGSGLLIVTLYHQRGFANGAKIVLSSPEAANSVCTNGYKTVKDYKDSVTGQKRTGYECN